MANSDSQSVFYNIYGGDRLGLSRLAVKIPTQFGFCEDHSSLSQTMFCIKSPMLLDLGWDPGW